MYVVAGPNGAGKSTLTRGARDAFGVSAIDADVIQREAGVSSASAWSEGLRRCREALARDETFLIETTLAGSDPARPSTYLRLMREAKSRGYRIDLTLSRWRTPMLTLHESQIGSLPVSTPFRKRRFASDTIAVSSARLTR